MNKFQTKAFANLVASVLFIILGLWAWIETGTLQHISSTYVQPSMFPRIMIVGLLIFAVVLLIQSIIKLLNMKADDDLAAPAGTLNLVKDKGVRAAAAVILLCIFFVAMFNILGYLITSTIISLVIMYMIGKRNWLQMVLVSILVPFAMWLIFYKVLTVNIPMGPLNFMRLLVDMI